MLQTDKIQTIFNMKKADKLIFMSLTILNRMVIIYELNNFLTKNREELN